MKNSIKTCFIALTIAIAAAACSGDRSGRPGDSSQTDSSAINSSQPADSLASGKGTPPAGTNGSSAPIDSGMDKSGSGGTDSTKRP